jgi:phosphoenolpyruvate carboxylase
VRRLLRRVQAFGFHLAALDLRQESSQHDAALAALLGDPGFPARPWAERAQRLRDLVAGTDPAANPDAADAARVLAVFRTVAGALPRYGARAIGAYIISMSRSAADALAVLALARQAGCLDANGAVPLDVAPLFETVDDLDAAAGTLRSLFADPVYREHLRERGDRQVVMLGYSDSAKDGGLVASRWALQQTQVQLTALAAEAGVRIAFFHGRGGSLSRGGGKTGRAVVAAPRGSVDGYLRLTEQGEVIHRKYGIRALALRNLEQATGAVLRATLRPRKPEPREAAWREMAAAIAAAARAHYRGLVYEREGFVDYFRAATPIDVIERLRIGSRPSKRGNAGGVSSLRAIPWVFAWSQNRCGLTAWLGVGTGLAHGIERFGHDAVAEMARDWPFFATLVDDVEMVLAKSDLGIFERYSRLAGDAHAHFFPGIAAEFERTRAAILSLKGTQQLLEGDFRLRQSIRLRNPYVDPLSLLQVDLLARWRAAGRPEDALFHALVTTVNGIAAGVQNTG